MTMIAALLLSLLAASRAMKACESFAFVFVRNNERVLFSGSRSISRDSKGSSGWHGRQLQLRQRQRKAADVTMQMAVDGRPPMPKRSARQAMKTTKPPQRRTRSDSINKRGYARRKAAGGSGSKRSSSSSKPPKWEKEGDLLYQSIAFSSDGTFDFDFESDSSSARDAPVVRPETVAQAREVLSRFANVLTELEEREKLNARNLHHEGNEETATNQQGNPALWGKIPVGPMLKQRLVSAGFREPTPIQSAAFAALASPKKRPNVLLASPTGSGKTLAYLIPLLTSPPKGKRLPGMYFVLTPTVELAAQLSWQVQQFWPEDDRLVDVLKPDQDDDNLLATLSDAPIVAGTPKVMRAFFQQVQNTLSNDDTTLSRSIPGGGRRNDDILSDIISEMEASIGGAAETAGEMNEVDLKSKARAIQNNLCTVVLDEADRLLQTERVARGTHRRGASVTEQLLDTLLKFKLKNKFQIIGASATVGRILRRQIMEMVQAPSMDAAATLVTGEGDVRTRKDEAKRRSSVTPSTLEHRYHLVEERDEDAALDKDERYKIASLRALNEVLQAQPAAATLIFPGRVGIPTVVEDLSAKGFENVQTLSVDLITAAGTDSDGVPPIYVVGDRFGRGLDLPDVRYVVLLSPPSSAAGYTHLAGRTGRNGQVGTAITLVRPKEAPKLAIIANALGMRLTELEREMEQEPPAEQDDEIVQEWRNLSQSALQRKTIPQLREFLDGHHVEYLQERPKKADLIAAVKDYLDAA